MPELLVSLGMANTKPFVQVAAFCENVIEDKEGVPTLVRVIDTYYIEVPKLPDGVKLPDNIKPTLELTGLIGLKSGDLKGTYKISLVLRKPSGEQQQLSPAGGSPIVLNGGAHGFNMQLKLHLALAPSELGLFWFDVIFEGEVLTSMPLNLISGPKPVAAAS